MACITRRKYIWTRTSPPMTGRVKGENQLKLKPFPKTFLNDFQDLFSGMRVFLLQMFDGRLVFPDGLDLDHKHDQSEDTK